MSIQTKMLSFEKGLPFIHIAMTKCMQKNLNWLKALQCCSNLEKKQIIEAARSESVNAICDCIQNILLGNIEISPKEKRVLNVKKEVLRKLANRKTKSAERKKLLIQHGGGFLNSVLGPVLGALGSIFL